MTKLYYVADIEFDTGDEDPITLGDGKYVAEVPCDGEILGGANGPKIGGCILDAGTGTGKTQIQVRNVEGGRDYFTTAPEFRVADKDANGRAPLQPGILCTRPTFTAGQHLALDIDARPSGADSARAHVFLTCGFWFEVD